MGTLFGGDATSRAGAGIDIDGTGVIVSLEGGYPIALTESWTLEPQAQLIWQHLSLDEQRDAFSTVNFDSDDAVTGRLGFRLQGDLPTETATFQPYLKANLWHSFDADQRVTFGTEPIVTETGGTALEIGGGIVARLHDQSRRRENARSGGQYRPEREMVKQAEKRAAILEQRHASKQSRP